MTDSYVVVDVETTGLNPKKDRLLEIGALKYQHGELVGTFSRLINPRCRLSDQVRELTGITQEMADRGRDSAEVVREFISFAEALPLVGHHLIFDYSFIKRVAVNQGISYERNGIDTLKISRVLLADLPSRTLEALCKHFDIFAENHHRALDDAMSTQELLEHLAKQETEANETLFRPKPLLYKIKKEKNITNQQKRYLIDLLKYHRIELGMDIDSLTRNEASRKTDEILTTYGRPKRR